MATAQVSFENAVLQDYSDQLEALLASIKSKISEKNSMQNSTLNREIDEASEIVCALNPKYLQFIVFELDSIDQDERKGAFKGQKD